MDEGRKQDIIELDRARKTAPDKETLYNIDRVKKTIKNEQYDGYLRSAREALVKAAKTGKGNVRDVQERILKKSNSGIGKTTFMISFPKGLK